MDGSAVAVRKVATLHIPKQDFRRAERDEMSERLAFSPAHAGVDHRPIGAVNRARMRIYKLLSGFRHARDQRTPAPKALIGSEQS
jgi:hypothetical protein